MANDETAQPQPSLSDYDQVISEVFRKHYIGRHERLEFDKDELVAACQARGLTVRNIPDIIYTFRIRRNLPSEIRDAGHWAIEPAGRGRYAFRPLRNPPRFDLRLADISAVDIPNAIPEVVEPLLRADEQSLLTRVLYNRLVDIFTGLTCFHIQNHYRAFVRDHGEVEVDALYVGVDRQGGLFVVPAEAKSANEADIIGRIQVSQMVKLVKQDFPHLSARILAVKSLADGTIGFIEFDAQDDPDELGILSVTRFRLVRRRP